MSLSNLDIKYFKISVGQENIGKESSVDIVARCPICGDSQKNKRSKRLHLYIKNNETRINCFNSGCKCTNKSTYGFLKSFYPNLLENYKRENFIQNLSHLSGNSESGDVFANITNTTTKKWNTRVRYLIARWNLPDIESCNYWKDAGKYGI